MSSKIVNRDISLDIAKGILIILVVFAHTLESIVTDNMYVSAIHAAIYCFHMPAFVFISGYLSKNDEKSYQKSIAFCLIPYLVLNTVFAVVKRDPDLLTPGPTMWYFLCLFYWRVTTGAFKRIKFIIPVSIAVALYLGFVSSAGEFLAVSRAICFYPIYLLGYFCTEADLKRLYKVPAPVSYIVFSLSVLLSVAVKLFVFPTLSYAMKDPYDMSSAQTAVTDALKRAFLICIFSVCTLAFLSIIGKLRKESFISSLGKRTVSVYALHIFIIHGVFKAVKHFNIIDFSALPLWCAILISAVFSFALVLFLGSKFIFEAYNWIFGGIAKLFIKESTSVQK